MLRASSAATCAVLFMLCTCGLAQTQTEADCIAGSEEFDASSSTCVALQLTCTQCAQGEYLSGDVCVSCANYETTAAQGATSVDACVCELGAGLAADACAECTWDTYSNVLADEACVDCPANSGTATQGAETNTECLCIPGYEESAGGVCVACNSGYAKVSATSFVVAGDSAYQSPYTVSSASCTACPANQYSDFAAASSCHKCPYYSSNAGTGQDAQSCACDSNFGTNEQSVLLKAHTLDITTDNDFYDDLDGRCGYPVDNTDPANSKYFQHGGTVNESFANVFCRSIGGHSGYIASRNPTRNRRSDSWQSQTMITGISCSGTESDISGCSLTSTGPGSPNIFPVRVCCAVNPVTSTHSTYTHKTCDTCNPGYVVDGSGVCTACGPRTYSVSETRTDVPNMPPGETSVVVNTACVDCPTGSTSPDASADVNYCKCNAGYEGSLRSASGSQYCAQCYFGKYRTETGLAPPNYDYDQKEAYYACDDCPADTVASDSTDRTTQANACAPCPAGSTTQGRTAVWATLTHGCMCNKGYSRVGPPDSYYTQTGQICEQCAAGTYKHWVSNPFEMGQDQSDNWVCFGGECLPGTIPELSNQDASQDCLLCDAGKYSTALGATTEDVCQECEAGTFSGNDGSTECSPCPQGTYQGGTGATQCTECPANSYVETDSLVQDEYIDVQDCQCLRGYYFDADFTGSECQPCPPGFACNNNVQTPCSGNTYSTGGAFECTACPVNSVIPDGGVQIDEASCKCDVGYTGPDGGSCQECPNGEIKDTIGSDPCVQCAAGKFSFGLAECKDCMENSHSNAGIWDFMECTCNAGYERKIQEGMIRSVDMIQCDPCPDNQYCVGNNNARDCPPQSTSPTGSDSEHDCTCNNGYHAYNISHEDVNDMHFDDAEHDGYVHHDSDVTHAEPHKFCRLCSDNHYCFNDDENPCPAASSSPAGSDAVTDCLCLAKHWRNGCTRDYEDSQPFVKHEDLPLTCDQYTVEVTGADRQLTTLNTNALFIGKKWRIAPFTNEATASQQCRALLLCDIRDPFFYNDCVECPQDYYCMIGTSGTHTVAGHCPEHSTAPAASDEIADCKCTAGYRRKQTP